MLSLQKPATPTPSGRPAPGKRWRPRGSDLCPGVYREVPAPLARAAGRAWAAGPASFSLVLFVHFWTFPQERLPEGSDPRPRQALHEGFRLQFTYSSLFTIRFSSIPLVLTQKPVWSPTPGSRGADVFAKCLPGRKGAHRRAGWGEQKYPSLAMGPVGARTVWRRRRFSASGISKPFETPAAELTPGLLHPEPPVGPGQERVWLRLCSSRVSGAFPTAPSHSKH